jgi:hypothetical protein
MRMNRRSLLAGVIGAGAIHPDLGLANNSGSMRNTAAQSILQALDRAAAAPVLRLDGLKSPVIIESIRLLKKEKEYLVHVRSKDGAEGIALTNPPRAECLDHILQQLVAPFFIGKILRHLKPSDQPSVRRRLLRGSHCTMRLNSLRAAMESESPRTCSRLAAAPKKNSRSRGELKPA